ncbi:MAG: hypothetical protein Q7T14_12270, partial [Aestuariivirga sp.]|nr:hypothetical protein [Aestuariivirga sp.]
ASFFACRLEVETLGLTGFPKAGAVIIAGAGRWRDGRKAMGQAAQQGIKIRLMHRRRSRGQ